MSTANSTANKVLDILMLFDESRPILTAEEISELINIPRSSTYRYIRTLGEKGFVQNNVAGKYQLGPAFLKFEPLIHWGVELRKIALPVMEDIMRKTSETVLLTRRFGHYSVCAERVEGSHAIRITFNRGHTQPLHAGASSKILLACGSEDEWDHYLSKPLESFTENTITDPKQLKAHLHEIREQGYCLSQGEVDVGAIAIAVPIFNKNNHILAALSVAGPEFRINNAKIEHYLEALRVGAAIIEEKIR